MHSNCKYKHPSTCPSVTQESMALVHLNELQYSWQSTPGQLPENLSGDSADSMVLPHTFLKRLVTVYDLPLQMKFCS